MATINDLYQSLLFARATDLEGYEEHLVVAFVTLLNEVERDLVGQIQTRLEELPPNTSSLPSDYRLRRLREQLDKIRGVRERAWREANSMLGQELLSFRDLEVDWTREAFARATQLVGFELASPSAASLRAVATKPFNVGFQNARPLLEWLQILAADDMDRIENAIRIGYIEGQTTEEIIKRIRGTRANRYRDGLLQITRNQADAIVRTALNHYANAAREATWLANSDIMYGLVWASVLDGRTTPVCSSRDGHVAPIGNRPLDPQVKLPLLVPHWARPPAHGRCRSIMVALISPLGLIGDRPFVIDKSTPSQRRINFAREARERGVSVQQVREEWARERVGRVPARVPYEKWFSDLPPQLQRHLLGNRVAELATRVGGLSFSDIVSRAGRRYTQREIQARFVETLRILDL